MNCNQDVSVTENVQIRHVITAILNASSKDAKILAFHDLLEQFYENPESRIDALKEKIVSVLLQQRNNTFDKEILSAIQEALCLLGYVDPPQGHGIRILSIDGGGVRGILALKAMMKLEKLTGKPIYELFDYVCGVSTGAILACSIFPHKRSVQEVLQHYKELSKEVFQTNKMTGAVRLMLNHGYYNASKWEEFLQNLVGRTKMTSTSRDKTCPKISVVSTVVNTERKREYIFRNYEFRHNVKSQYYGSSEHLLWEAVRASSAAPVYFQEFKLGNYLHQDGGLMANNPCAVAIHEARLLWPGVPLQCVISLGTGLSKSDLCTKVVAKTTWADKFSILCDSATDGEAVHNTLSECLSKTIYYRFNPHLTEMIDMAEIQPEKITVLELDADKHYCQNKERYKAAAQTLLEPRQTSQKFKDWVSLKVNMFGLKSNL